MAREYRIDGHRVDARRMRKDARGMLVVQSYATRSGVFEYRRADGSTVRELRHPDDVFHPAHLESLSNASLTVGHPGQDVTPSNVGALEVGVVMEPRREGNFVAATLSVRRADAIRKVEAGALVELSCGYTLNVDPTPGVYEGQRYDQRQTDLRVNHVSLLPAGGGRAGREVRIRADSSTAEIVINPPTTFYPDTGGAMTNKEREEHEADLDRRLDEIEARLKNAGMPAPNSPTPNAQGARAAAEPESDDIDARLDAIERRLGRTGGGQ